MTSMLAAIKKNIPGSCTARSISKGGCKVSLRGAPQSRRIIDCDLPGAPFATGATKCDYLLLAEIGGNTIWAVPIELKKGRVDVGASRNQLQAGATAMDKIIPKQFQVQLLPLLASGSVSKAGKLEARDKVRFRGKDIPIKRIGCRDPLPPP